MYLLCRTLMNYGLLIFEIMHFGRGGWLLGVSVFLRGIIELDFFSFSFFFFHFPVFVVLCSFFFTLCLCLSVAVGQSSK